MQGNSIKTIKSESKKESKEGNKNEFKTPAKVKPPMRFGFDSARKETNKKSEPPVKRTQSVQNVGQMSMTTVKALKTPTSSASAKAVMKRAKSSQNVSGPKSARLSTPSNAMAYNAELLANFEKEKKALERRISELIKTSENRQRDNEKYKYEIKNLKSKLKEARLLLKDQQKQHNQQLKSHTTSPSQENVDEMVSLRRENSSLKQKLKELTQCLDEQDGSDKNLTKRHKVENKTDSDDSKNKSLSDAECRCVECTEHNVSSCPDKRSNISLDQWDRQSNKSSEGGEVSLHCLQDRILQMQENHYSTNEELQATLQELNDMQKTVNDLTDENEKLANERHVLLESLCSQTEKLENARLHVDFVKSLLLGDADLGGMSRPENERQLLSLVKSAQEEREELLLKQVEMSNCLQLMEKEAFEAEEVIEVLKSNVKNMENELDETIKLKQHFELQTSSREEELDQTRLDYEKLKIQLERDQKTISDMMQERKLLEENNEQTSLIDLLRKEKEEVCSRVVVLEQELSEKKFEVSRLTDNLNEARQQLNVASTRADSKAISKLAELEGQASRQRCRIVELEEELALAHKHIENLRLECEVHMDDKKTHALLLARAESEMRIYKSKSARAEQELKETRETFTKEQEDWLQFQQDLQKAVVIANEFKTEAQEDKEKVSLEIARKQEQVMILNKELNLSKAEIDHLKQQLSSATQQCQQLQQQLQQQQQQFAAFQPRSSSDWLNRDDSRDKILAERVPRRHSRLHDFRQQNSQLSVRTLISSIEQQMQQKTSPAVLDATRDPCSSSPSASSVCGASGSGVRATSPQKKHKISPLSSRLSNPYLRRSITTTTEDPKLKSLPLSLLTPSSVPDEGKHDGSPSHKTSPKNATKPLVGILNRPHRREGTDPEKNTSTPQHKVDPLAQLTKQLGGSKRNALLKWCQNKTSNYNNIDITNFSSSWNDGMAFCALLHTYLPHLIPYSDLVPEDKLKNFKLAFKAAESIGIPDTLDITEVSSSERPDWQGIMSYVKNIYAHFEANNIQS